jgi:hypothetical protein
MSMIVVFIDILMIPRFGCLPDPRLYRLNNLAVWWQRLGIRIERIQLSTSRPP